MTITIRAATPADAPVLARLNEPVQRLHAQAHPDVFKASTNIKEMIAHYTERLARADVSIFVADADGEPAGHAVAILIERPETPFTYAFRYLQVDEITVNPAHQRRGVGTALMAAVLQLAREKAIRTVRLDVYAFNEVALAFYARQGFNTYNRRLEINLDDAADLGALG